MDMAQEKTLSPKDIFNHPIQVGVLVRALDACLEKLDRLLGIGPFRIVDYPPAGEEMFREYQGKQGNFKAKFCFYHLGNIELELIQPLEGESVWEDFIVKHGPGIHHLKFMVPEFEGIKAYMSEQGYEISQQGDAVGINKGRVWAYYNTYEDIGFDVEIMNQ